MWGQLNEGLHAPVSPSEAVCSSHTSSAFYCQRQDSGFSGSLIWLNGTLLHFPVKMTMGLTLRLSCYTSPNFLQINSLLQYVYWVESLRQGFTVQKKVYSRSTDSKAPDWQGLCCEPADCTALPTETTAWTSSWNLLPVASAPSSGTASTTHHLSPAICSLSLDHKVTVPLYPCSRGCVHCASQSRSFLTVRDLLPRDLHSERASHCWVGKNPLQLCQLYKIQHFLFLRFILSHLLGETSLPHS